MVSQRLPAEVDHVSETHVAPVRGLSYEAGLQAKIVPRLRQYCERVGGIGRYGIVGGLAAYLMLLIVVDGLRLRVLLVVLVSGLLSAVVAIVRPNVVVLSWSALVAIFVLGYGSSALVAGRSSIGYLIDWGMHNPIFWFAVVVLADVCLVAGFVSLLSRPLGNQVDSLPGRFCEVAIVGIIGIEALRVVIVTTESFSVDFDYARLLLSAGVGELLPLAVIAGLLVLATRSNIVIAVGLLAVEIAAPYLAASVDYGFYDFGPSGTMFEIQLIPSLVRGSLIGMAVWRFWILSTVQRLAPQ